VVALLVRLKLSLLRNSLRRSTWRTVGLIIGAAYALAGVVAVMIGMIALRRTSVVLTADITVLGLSLLSLGWLFMSLLVFGVDETVDPAKFALLPVRARELLPGLLVAGLVGVPGLATVLTGLSLVITWARSPVLVVASLVGAVLGVVTCFLLSRAATSAMASVLASRRFRDLAFVGLALFGASFGVAGNLIGTLVATDLQRLRGVLTTLATIAAWTPFGWAWAIPGDVARGQWSLAGIHLVAAAGLALGLYAAWGHFLDVHLQSPIEGAGSGGKVRSGSVIERLYPATPAGGIAGRTLRYWRRDPRYVAGIAAFLVAPIVIVVTQLTNPHGSSAVAMLAPAVIGLMVGLSLAQDLSYDGTALWLHISAGVSGADDRKGRMLSTLMVYTPLIVVMIVATAVVTRRWELLPVTVGLTVTLTLLGLGVASVVGALWQWPAPPPGSNPFQKGNNGGLPSLLSFATTFFATLALGLPTIGLAVWSFFTPWVGYLVLPFGLVCGLIVLKLGISFGGRLLDRRWPEVMAAVSEKSG
jgi:ABC-2 type transport system permease protein